MNVNVDLSALAAELRDQLREELLAELRRDGERWPEYMDVKTAAAYLGVSVQRVRKLKDRRAIPYFQEAENCRVFFKRSDLDEWMREQRIECTGRRMT